MQETELILKRPRTDSGSDNSYYEFKDPYEVVDDYGKKETFHKKTIRLCIELDAEIDAQIALAQSNLDALVVRKNILENIVETPIE